MKQLQGLWLLLPSGLAMTWLVSKAQWFWNSNPDLQFGWVLLLLSLYMFWEAWERRPAVSLRLRWWGMALLLAGFVLLFLVQIYQSAFGTNAATMNGLALGVLTFAAGNVALVFGWPGVRAFALPYGFIMLALPLPGVVHGIVINGLQTKVAFFNTEVLNLIGIPAERTGSLIRLPAGTVGVDEACSGIRSLQSTIMATLFIGYLSLRRFSFQVLLLISGVMLAIFGNLIRSLYLCLEANAKGIDAVKEVHDAAGWSILAFTAVGVIILAWLFNKLDRSVSAELEVGAESEAPAAQAQP